jgi:hypothetical protein
MLSLCFQNKSSSTNIAIPASLYEGPFFYFYVESVYPFPSTLEANTCVNCALILTYLHICIHHITLCWQLSMRYACWKLKATAETYIFLCVASKLSTKNLLLYELTPMQVLLMLVLKVLFMKSICYMIQLFSHYLYHCFESLHSSHMLYNSIDQDYDSSMSLQKLSLLSFTYSRASRN